jgi:phosphate transport system protein
MPLHLVREIEKLKREILTLGAAVEKQLLQAARAIANSDEALAQEIIAADAEIDQMEVDLEEECLKVLALHQPVAIDLRYIIAILKINNDLERIGDLSGNLARRARDFSLLEDVPPEEMFGEMVEKVRSMLRDSLDALVRLDSDLARTVCCRDDEVDAMHKATQRRVREGIAAEPHRLDFFINVLRTSGHLERIADQATNIAEDVMYLTGGEIVRHAFGKKANPSEPGR